MPKKATKAKKTEKVTRAAPQRAVKKRPGRLSAAKGKRSLATGVALGSTAVLEALVKLHDYKETFDWLAEVLKALTSQFAKAVRPLEKAADRGQDLVEQIEAQEALLDLLKRHVLLIEALADAAPRIEAYRVERGWPPSAMKTFKACLLEAALNNSVPAERQAMSNAVSHALLQAVLVPPKKGREADGKAAKPSVAKI